MACPKCQSEFFIEYFPVFDPELREQLEAEGYSSEEIEYMVDLWENHQTATGGICLKCHHEWHGNGSSKVEVA